MVKSRFMTVYSELEKRLSLIRRVETQYQNYVNTQVVSPEVQPLVQTLDQKENGITAALICDFSKEPDPEQVLAVFYNSHVNIVEYCYIKNVKTQTKQIIIA